MRYQKAQQELKKALREYRRHAQAYVLTEEGNGWLSNGRMIMACSGARVVIMVSKPFA